MKQFKILIQLTSVNNGRMCLMFFLSMLRLPETMFVILLGQILWECFSLTEDIEQIRNIISDDCHKKNYSNCWNQ